ncbi:MAG: Ger(x)C family spore germination protein [Bacillota bacterium]|nr:Ger(x)C family spore germination protein [Bacillota bacterium]
MTVFRKILGVLLIIFLIFSSGCWNRVELNDRSIVLGAAIDKAIEEDKIMITAEIANPPQLISPVVGGGGGDDPTSWVISSTGWSTFDAVRNFTQMTTNKLFWSHNQVLVIGEELAREGIAPVLDFFVRDHELRRVAWVVIAKGATGKEIISVQHIKGGATGMMIDELVGTSESNSFAVQMDFTEFLSGLLNGSRGAIAGRIELVDAGEPEGVIEPEGGGNSGSQQVITGQGGSGGGNQQEPETLDLKQNLVEGELLRYTGGAVFKGDKLVGWLNRSEARGFNWVDGRVRTGIIVASSPEAEKPNVSIEVSQVNSNVTAEFEGNKPKVSIEVSIDGNLGGHMGNRPLSQDEGLMSHLEARTAEVVRSEIEAAITIAQELETDFFNFGSIFNRQHHQKWQQLKEDWQETYFPNLVVDIVVEMNIRRTGLINRPIIPDGN